MANCDINVERFAHDICVLVLERFGIFKAPDDTRKQNKYTSYDFLPCVSSSVVTQAIIIRDSFKKVLEDAYKTADPSNKEKIYNFFDYLLKNDKYEERNCSEKVCMSLALCTEYIQFVRTKDFAVSLDKLVIRWSDFFGKNLKEKFEEEGGFLKLDSDVKSARVDNLDKFHKYFISKYCNPYGEREYQAELVKMCAEKLSIPLDVNMTDIIKDFVRMAEKQSEVTRSEKSQSGLSANEEPKTRSKTRDSESSDSDTETSENANSEASQGVGSGASDSEISPNNLLGIPPHEEMLREIDPFFVDNIPLPPKPQSTLKSPEDQPVSSSPEQEVMLERMEQIISGMEHSLAEMRAFLFENGLIRKRSSRRGSGKRIKDSKDKKPPKGPEGLI